MAHPAFAAAHTRLPEAPAIAVATTSAAWLSAAGEPETLALDEAARRAGAAPAVYLCHARFVARRLGLAAIAALDVLELFAFVRPARFAVPTVRGLAAVLMLDPPETPAAEAASLFAVARALLAELTASPHEDAAAIAGEMAAAGWPWGEAVLTALGAPYPASGAAPSAGSGAFAVWRRLKEWEDGGPEPRPESWPVEPVEARARLVRLLAADAEPRPQQMAYAGQAAGAFQPRERAGEPRIVLAEAGTGVGKTLGYIAPASVWAQKNGGTVWISTYTRNLQRQIDRELDRAYPDFRRKTAKVVVRKGRENIFCLLNFEDAMARRALAFGREPVAFGLIARWALLTRDGDLSGGDFPAWLAGLFPAAITQELTDSHGECIYAACRHYRRCFVERAIRRARRAEIVVANHALVLTRAARGDEVGLPLRYVFDEAHHLFDAADSAFCLRLSGRETAELRRWLRGGEDGGRRSRRRGLADRIADLIGGDADAEGAVFEAQQAARHLPGPGWRQRVGGGSPIGAAERFLALVRQQVYARNADGEHGYGLETTPQPPVDGLLAAAASLDGLLERLLRPLGVLTRTLTDRLDAEAASLDAAQRQRIEALRRSLERRALAPVIGWQAMLRSLAAVAPPEFVDAFSVERGDHGEVDVAFSRHWLDPTAPFVDSVLRPAHGALITSATLRDTTGDDDADWAFAERATGMHHLEMPPALSVQPSPFDYASLTRVLVVTDIDRNDIRQLASAYRELFIGAGGGGLGLFTAIGRLRAVHAEIAAPLEAAGIRLLAQHVDGMDTGTLIDIFRAEEDSCLLGTDAVRDGVDVPGRSLRLIVFDRVPWPRPTLLHRARRAEFGGRAYEERLTRMKLKQAYGRLIRRADDRGVFVILDRALPSRLTSAFPEGVPVRRLGLADAVAAVHAHLARS